MHASFIRQFLYSFLSSIREGVEVRGGNRRIKVLNLFSKSIIHVDGFTMHACRVGLRKICETILGKIGVTDTRSDLMFKPTHPT